VAAEGCEVQKFAAEERWADASRRVWCQCGDVASHHSGVRDDSRDAELVATLRQGDALVVLRCRQPVPVRGCVSQCLGGLVVARTQTAACFCVRRGLLEESSGLAAPVKMPLADQFWMTVSAERKAQLVEAALAREEVVKTRHHIDLLITGIRSVSPCHCQMYNCRSRPNML
jgi:hypothetical protein